MSLTLTDIAPVIYEAKEQVARELTGAINSVVVNTSSTELVTLNSEIDSYRTAEPTLNETYTPSMTIPEGDAQEVKGDTLIVDKVANVKIPLTGQNAAVLQNAHGVDTVLKSLFAQGIRKIVNKIESNTCIALKNGSSRAVGTAGTTPFAADFKILALLGKVLKDNGAPEDGERSLVIDTSAGANLRGLTTLNSVADAGDNGALLRQGELLNLQGFSLKESAGVAVHTKGTGAGYLANGAAALKANSITLDTGTGTILPGDIVTFAADTANKYVVNTALASNAIGIGYPGLFTAIPDNNALTVGNGYTGNIGLHKTAAELALRAPAQPLGGDAAVDRIIVGDDRTGLVFEVALYRGYGKVMFDITVFYGIKVWKPEFVATLLG